MVTNLVQDYVLPPYICNYLAFKKSYNFRHSLLKLWRNIDFLAKKAGFNLVRQFLVSGYNSGGYRQKKFVKKWTVFEKGAFEF